MTLQSPEQQRVSVCLQVLPTASHDARRSIGAIEQLSRSPDLCFVAQLLAAELVGNVVRHSGLSSGRSFRLEAEWDRRAVRVEVVDGGDGYDPLAVLADHRTAERGHRGVALVDALADRWGYRRRGGECRVWFELVLIPGRRPWQGREPVH